MVVGDVQMQDINIPLRGWRCEKVIIIHNKKLKDCEACPICGREHSGFVHVLSNRDYPENIKVDAACAEKLMDDYINPVIRERELLDQYKRRMDWISRSWQLSDQGNDFINILGINIVVYEDKSKPGEWTYHIKGGSNRKLYGSKELAKMAVFNKLWKVIHSNHLE